MNGEFDFGENSPLVSKGKCSASFYFHAVTEDTVFIVDNDNESKSITNDAYQVVIYVLKKHPGKKIIYRDTIGRWDALNHNGKLFTGFRRLTEEEQKQFKKILT